MLISWRAQLSADFDTHTQKPDRCLSASLDTQAKPSESLERSQGHCPRLVFPGSHGKQVESHCCWQDDRGGREAPEASAPSIRPPYKASTPTLWGCWRRSRGTGKQKQSRGRIRRGQAKAEEGTSAQPRPRVRCVSTTRQSKHSCVAPPPERVTPARAVPGGSGTSAWLVRVGAAGLARGRHGDRLGSPRVPDPRDWSGRGPGR